MADWWKPNPMPAPVFKTVRGQVEKSYPQPETPARPANFKWDEQHKWNKFTYFVLAAYYAPHWNWELGFWTDINVHIAYNKGVVSVQSSNGRYEANGVIPISEYLDGDFSAVAQALGSEARGLTLVLRTRLTAKETLNALKGLGILKKYNS